MIRVFFEWGYEHRHVDAATLLAVRAVRLPVASARDAAPHPYRPSELRVLRTTLDARWPKLADDEAEKWLRRYRDGRSPYSRVRSHAIRCQLDAILTLALHLGLRRREIFALDIVMAHPELRTTQLSCGATISGLVSTHELSRSKTRLAEQCPSGSTAATRLLRNIPDFG
jgi:hypothetical protein